MRQDLASGEVPDGTSSWSRRDLVGCETMRVDSSYPEYSARLVLARFPQSSPTVVAAVVVVAMGDGLNSSRKATERSEKSFDYDRRPVDKEQI